MDSLSEDQVSRVTEIWKLFNEYNPSTLEEAISAFQGYDNPDLEIQGWEEMARLFKAAIAGEEELWPRSRRRLLFLKVLVSHTTPTSG